MHAFNNIKNALTQLYIIAGIVTQEVGFESYFQLANSRITNSREIVFRRKRG